MIAYLPEIYPDELVYSWFCRYYVHSGCIDYQMALRKILYKRSNNPSKEFLGHLSPEMEQKIKQMYPIEDLILNHTMYPQYARFLPLEKKRKALYHMAYEFCDAHHLFTILPRDEEDRYMKYCPLCIGEDREKYNEAYWHRTHQIRNMNVCPKHRCKLIVSNVTAISNQTFTLSPLEAFIENMKVEYIDNPVVISYVEYLAEVFHKPIDLKNDTPISAILYHAMRNTEYMKTEKVRYTTQFAEDLKLFYENMGVDNSASLSQIQRTLLSKQTEFSTVCQIAFYLRVSVQELTESILAKEQIEVERKSHYARKRVCIDWEELDNSTEPILKLLASDIYSGVYSKDNRPEKVSIKRVCRELNLSEHRLVNMPKCKAILKQYEELYPESWARKVIWAYDKLKEEKKDEIYWSDIRLLTGVKKHNFKAVIPYLDKYADTEKVRMIVGLVGNW